MIAGIFAIVILATVIAAVVWDLISNPFRIEERVMGGAATEALLHLRTRLGDQAGSSL